jgi:hypothetical protein
MKTAKNRRGRIVCLSLGAAVWLLVGARAEVRSYTVGIDVNCPSGLGE